MLAVLLSLSARPAGCEGLLESEFCLAKKVRLPNFITSPFEFGAAETHKENLFEIALDGGELKIGTRSKRQREWRVLSECLPLDCLFSGVFANRVFIIRISDSERKRWSYWLQSESRSHAHKCKRSWNRRALPCAPHTSDGRWW